MYLSNQYVGLALTLLVSVFGSQQLAAEEDLPDWLFPIPIGCERCDGAGGPGPVTVTIQQVSTGRYFDAYKNNKNNHDYRLMTRKRQSNKTQRWKLTSVGNSRFTIQQVSNGRYLDAHESDAQDFGLVTRPRQDNKKQQWILKSLGKSRFTIRQGSNGRYVDAHEIKNQDFRIVTRSRQRNNSQHWLIREVK